ncbi:MAG: restriction endonuclease subunit S [Patescibacteria group bacterium]|nr:restriction endonuclease subunit S [Patescibacteria group bacterium]
MDKIQSKLKQTPLGSIPEGWKELELEKIAVIIKDVFAPNGQNDLSYIGLEHINQQDLSLNSIGRSSEVKSNKFRFQAGDILFGKLRPYFRKIYRPNFSGVCSTDIWAIRAKEGIDQKWLFYLLATQDFIDAASGGSSGTRMPRADWKHLKDMIWLVPNIIEQRRIASILTSLDDKIELNRQINATLEKIASALYKNWFVDDIDPNNLPEGWRVTRLGDVIKFNYGKALKEEDRKKGNVKVFGSSGFVGFHNEKLAVGPGIVVGRKGNVGSMYWSAGDFYPIDTTYYITSELPLTYCYFLLKSLSFVNGDSVVPGLNRGQAYGIEIFLPGRDVLNKFDKVAMNLREMMNVNEKENDTLTFIRDLLLPRLMSGKIRIEL